MYYSLISFLQDEKIHYVENHSLKNENSLKIDTKVDLSVYPSSNLELVEVAKFTRASGFKTVVVGNISNILFRNAVYHGVVIHTRGIKTFSLYDDIATLGCGCSISSAIRQMAEHGYGGLESLAGIPGTIGGMIPSNAGAFGSEISDFLIDTQVFDSIENKFFTFLKEKIGFSYRNSMFYNTDRYIILSSRLQFLPLSKNEINERILSFRQKRNTTQPHQPSLGSVFKRQDNIGAGYYIDRAGLKGMRVGDAVVSPIHAGFIVNVGNATAHDFLSLVERIKEKIYTDFGIALDTEIKIID